jgi:hypothetical protein
VLEGHELPLVEQRIGEKIKGGHDTRPGIVNINEE